MKTIFDKLTRDELINRINTVNESSTAKWGKMSLSDAKALYTVGGNDTS